MERKEPSFKVRSYRSRYVFAGNEVRHDAQTPRFEERMSFRLDTTQSPKWIDLTVETKAGEAPAVPGIYAVENGRLRLCVNWSGSAAAAEGVRLSGPGRLRGVRDGPVAVGERGAGGRVRGVLSEWERAERAHQEKPDRDVRRGKAVSLADRCLKIAEKDSDGPTGLAALCWAACVAPDSAAGKKAPALLGDGRLGRASPRRLAGRGR